MTLYDREATVAARLEAVPQAPRLITWFGEGPWRTLIFEDIDGRSPALPWDRQELDRVLLALADMAERLTPSPVHDLPPPPGLPTLRGFQRDQGRALIEWLKIVL